MNIIWTIKQIDSGPDCFQKFLKCKLIFSDCIAKYLPECPNIIVASIEEYKNKNAVETSYGRSCAKILLIFRFSWVKICT